MRRNHILLGLGAAGLALVILLLSLAALHQLRLKSLRERLVAVRRAVEQYAWDGDGSYPHSLDEVVARGYLEALPLNPYSGAPMRVIQLTDIPQAGDIVYVPCGVTGGAAATNSARQSTSPALVNQYLLAAYGPLSPGQSRAYPGRVRVWQQSLGPPGAAAYYTPGTIPGPIEADPSGTGNTRRSSSDYRPLVPAWDLLAVRLSDESPDPMR